MDWKRTITGAKYSARNGLRLWIAWKELALLFMSTAAVETIGCPAIHSTASMDGNIETFYGRPSLEIQALSESWSVALWPSTSLASRSATGILTPAE
jgi:hypothetical protein